MVGSGVSSAVMALLWFFFWWHLSPDNARCACVLLVRAGGCVPSRVGARTVPVSLEPPPECLRPGGIAFIPSTRSPPGKTQD